MKKVKELFASKRATKADSVKDDLRNGNKTMPRKDSFQQQRGDSKKEVRTTDGVSKNEQQDGLKLIIVPNVPSNKSLKSEDDRKDGALEFVRFGDINRKTSLAQGGDLEVIRTYSSLAEMQDNREKFLNMSLEEKKKFYTKGFSPVRYDKLDSIATMYTSGKLQPNENKSKYPVGRDLNNKVFLWYGDICRLEVDAIVNSVVQFENTNEIVSSESGVSASILSFAGYRWINEEIALSNEMCPVTSGYYLPAKYVIHGQSVRYVVNNPDLHLKEAYLECLQKAKAHGFRTIAFPCISTGQQGFPRLVAAKIALSTVREWLSDESNASQVEAVIFCIYRDKTNWKVYSNLMSLYFPADSQEINKGPVIPTEILRMDEGSLKLYRQALKDGIEKVYNIRAMVVGHYGVGKTTLVHRLLGKDVNILDRTSTEGIDIHMHCFDVSLTSQEWTVQEKDAEKYNRLQRLVKLINEKVQMASITDEEDPNENLEEVQRERTPGAYASKDPDDKNIKMVENLEQLDFRSQRKESLEEVNTRHGEEKYCNSDEKNVVVSRNADFVSSGSEKNDPEMEILELLVENADRLERVKVAKAGLSLWDFAGQFVFYTTHQTFLTRRAVYLLVIDLSQQITDLVKDDECFFDREGMKFCKVHDLVEVWMNSIHTCSPFPEAGIPVVILVGTHADQIPQNCRQKVCESVFAQIRYQLQDKPTRFHLANEDFVIDNTILDPKLEELKRKIVELASQQPFWGEEVPARWLHLEQILMKLKAAGVKVIPYSLVESLNKNATIQIETKEELDLFLRYLHDTGTILYFNTVRLREKIVLEPQWLIDALKSLITAEMFVLKNPAVISKWSEFKEKGKLTLELIDAVWTKQENPELHDNKEHILLLMEQLNIVSRPRSFSKNGDEVKVENYLIAPCMLRQMTPKEVINPKPNPQMESTSVLCYIFKEKFLPPPIFHRLVASCMACWPIAKNKVETLIFCGSCVFDLDHSHRLYLHFRDYVIFARITRMGIKERTPNFKVCLKVREFIREKLSEILECVGQRLDFELGIQCSKCDGDSVDQIVPLSVLQGNVELACHCHDNSHVIISHDLLKFWFEDSGKDKVDGPSSCLPLNILDEVPLEKHLNRLSMKIGKEYVQLGIELDVPWSRIEQIQMENPRIPTQCFKILQEWVQRSNGQATFRILEKACRCVGIDVSILSQIF
ncbi:hypothetical protein CHS0354_021162 [Potamilus streckersoni]|uniref:non-specific serine/threonine protein kinase n=1 Tax=Potamilus streckersoni TaxID=2493646 RepID=A0AAE0W5S7_9BIVA|nr:hypothetical protein CHS0354_021162 [Potamilus streckersoni]